MCTPHCMACNGGYCGRQTYRRVEVIIEPARTGDGLVAGVSWWLYSVENGLAMRLMALVRHRGGGARRGREGGMEGGGGRVQRGGRGS